MALKDFTALGHRDGRVLQETELMKRENADLVMLHVIGLTGSHLAQPRNMRSSSCLRVAFPRVVDIMAIAHLLSTSRQRCWKRFICASYGPGFRLELWLRHSTIQAKLSFLHSTTDH